MKNISGYSYKKFARTPFQGCNSINLPFPRVTPSAHPGLQARTPFQGCLVLMLCMCGTVEAEPWGKDADLVGKRSEYVAPTPCATPLFGQFGETMIKFHQDVISPADGPRSNFRPSSSQYMLDAMRKYGFFKGFSMGCDRLMRENEDPWVYRKAPNENGEMMKWDPVP